MNIESSKTNDGPERLAALLQTTDFIPFLRDVPDNEHPQVRCSIYGAIKTNELFVELTNGRVSFVAIVPSPLLHPPMADRLFGMDADDADEAFAAAEQLWKQHKDALLRKE